MRAKTPTVRFRFAAFQDRSRFELKKNRQPISWSEGALSTPSRNITTSTAHVSACLGFCLTSATRSS
jgi:hypothetical protein